MNYSFGSHQSYQVSLLLVVSAKKSGIEFSLETEVCFHPQRCFFKADQRHVGDENKKASVAQTVPALWINSRFQPAGLSGRLLPQGPFLQELPRPPKQTLNFKGRGKERIWSVCCKQKRCVSAHPSSRLSVALPFVEGGKSRGEVWITEGKNQNKTQQSQKPTTGIMNGECFRHQPVFPSLHMEFTSAHEHTALISRKGTARIK